MALYITVAIGQQVKVGDTLLKVVTAHSSSDFLVECQGKEFEITEDDWVTVASGVEIRATYPRPNSKIRGVRMEINAPEMYVQRL